MKIDGEELKQFLAERCVIKSDLSVSSGELWKAWVAWCSSQDIYHGFSQKEFARSLKGLDYVIVHRRSGSHVLGIALRKKSPKKALTP